jgi:hypothetical protein
LPWLILAQPSVIHFCHSFSSRLDHSFFLFNAYSVFARKEIDIHAGIKYVNAICLYVTSEETTPVLASLSLATLLRRAWAPSVRSSMLA